MFYKRNALKLFLVNLLPFSARFASLRAPSGWKACRTSGTQGTVWQSTVLRQHCQLPLLSQCNRYHSVVSCHRCHTSAHSNVTVLSLSSLLHRRCHSTVQVHRCHNTVTTTDVTLVAVVTAVTLGWTKM